MTVFPKYDKYLKDVSSNYTALPDKPEETPESILKALWLLAKGQPCSAEKAKITELSALDDAERPLLEEYITRWTGGEPLAYITGRQQFCGLEFLVGREALIPRKETEILAYKTLEKIDGSGFKAPLIVDICTGCGNLPIVFKNRYPDAQVYGSDLSVDAIDLAQKNAEFHRMNNSLQFVVGDLLTPFEELNLNGKIDFLTCNPPYISSQKVSTMAGEISKHEPSMAFDGGAFGITIVHRTIKDSAKYIKPGGWLLFEVGIGQGEPTLKNLGRSTYYTNIETGCDANNQIRVIAAQRAPNT